MAWTSFHCENPDFTVRSVADGTTFEVQRAAMQRSDVFRDMFSCCEANATNAATPAATDDTLDLHESSPILTVLLRLLHDPPAPPVRILDDESELRKIVLQLPKIRYDPMTVIPLPLLVSLLFELVDKYALSESVTETLREQLLANVPTHPLQVYGFATLHGMDRIASEATQYLRPMASYRLSDIKLIPTVEAYHKVVRLQDLRVKTLRELVLSEDIFPHGYGECSSHRDTAISYWNRQRKALAGRIETGTDVAGEMGALTNTFTCKACHKACNAAVDMLAYKCRKVPRMIHQLPAEN
ncbi:hypothetical protein BDQ12DRAFT_437031 [Crucibulum laeve]|uniref:BTB domain-containing protein n=1 Tax=Crucibulum laeve TaxID=68775 RepID=A0A5C3M9I2_9AGAR|nr:hypothetical protein BDQ12DRAFT_437031 [Crucibulum laeve]